MKTLPESNAGWAQYYDRLRQKADDCYQDTGDPKYATRSYKYGACADAFSVAADTADWKATEKQRRATNIQHIIDSLDRDSYTKDEVKRVLTNIMYF